MHIYIHKYVYVCVYTHIYMYTYNVCTDVCMYADIHIYIHDCIHTLHIIMQLHVLEMAMCLGFSSLALLPDQGDHLSGAALDVFRQEQPGLK